jgi:alpha-N-arabinofuranosidase
MMRTSQITFHPDYTVGPVPHRLFGSFVEHMGRCVYGGIFEPGHPAADGRGFRGDVADLVTELGVTVVRYPGGNFVSGYRWEDGVGPVADRPSRLDLAWRSLEPNLVGTNEFLDWCGLVRTEPMLAVNLGTRGIAEACDLLEYVNHPGGTALAELRAAHGHREPYGVKLWCLGNEMDGPWQTGHKTADEYGRLAAETARAMRQIDPTIELVVCGSSNAQMPTFGQWEATVLDHSYDDVDYISLHAYYERGQDDLSTFLAAGVGMDAFIEGVIATADHVAVKKRSSKRLKLSFDEWNLWGESDYAGHPDVPWQVAPRLIEETYDVTKAVVFGSLMMSLLRHADRVGVACLAQLVNVIAPIRAESNTAAWRQTIFYPFALTAQHARGEVLRPRYHGARYESRYGDADLVDVVGTYDFESGELVIILVSRATDEDVAVEVDLRGFRELVIADQLLLGGEGLDDVNSAVEPERVAPRRNKSGSIEDKTFRTVLPPVSWSIVRLSAAGSS